MALRDRVVVMANDDWSGRIGTVVDYRMDGKVGVHLDHPADEPCEQQAFFRADLALMAPKPNAVAE